MALNSLFCVDSTRVSVIVISVITLCAQARSVSGSYNKFLVQDNINILFVGDLEYVYETVSEPKVQMAKAHAATDLPPSE